jgi:hypothetical protein
MPPARSAAVTVLALRIAYGAGLIATPAPLTKRWLGDSVHRSPTQIALRGLGAREVVLHTGALAVGLRGGPLRPWLLASAVGDLADVAATVAGRDGVPDGSPKATVAVAGGSALISVAVAAVLDE